MEFQLKSAYIAVREFTDEDGNEESGNGSCCVGKSQQCAGIVGRDVDVVGQESAVHTGYEHCA